MKRIKVLVPFNNNVDKLNILYRKKFKRNVHYLKNYWNFCKFLGHLTIKKFQKNILIQTNSELNTS